MNSHTQYLADSPEHSLEFTARVDPYEARAPKTWYVLLKEPFRNLETVLCTQRYEFRPLRKAINGKEKMFIA